MRVTVGVGRCVASGQCSNLVPRVFGRRAVDAKAELLDDSLAPELHDAVRDAESLCPAVAIRIVESGQPQR